LLGLLLDQLLEAKARSIEFGGRNESVLVDVQDLKQGLRCRDQLLLFENVYQQRLELVEHDFPVFVFVDPADTF
tara:strand:- start:3264 stop:3485 length:222 start_codon:yes stop_codon:yes gene_type:complete